MVRKKEREREREREREDQRVWISEMMAECLLTPLTGETKSSETALSSRTFGESLWNATQPIGR